MPDLLERQETLLLEGPETGEGESHWSGQFMGGEAGGFGWYPPEAEPEPIEGIWRDVTGPAASATDKARREREKRAAEFLKRKEEYEESERRTKLEELKARTRGYKRAYRPQPGKWIRTYLKPRPQPDLAKIYFPGRALRETYIPRPPVKTTLEQIKGIREISAPQMGLESSLGRSVVTDTESLKRAGSPPPTPRIKTPARNPEEFEGLGPALVRLRKAGELKKVDQAVLTEVAGNGDIDTPTHVRSEVGKLGFTVKEIDLSLKRLRDMGFLTPSGRVSKGERELELSGGANG